MKKRFWNNNKLRNGRIERPGKGLEPWVRAVGGYLKCGIWGNSVSKHSEHRRGI